MKKKIWIVLIIALAILTTLVIRYSLFPKYEFPCQSEEVDTMVISNFWEYKIVEDAEQIENILTQFKQAKIVSRYGEMPSRAKDGQTGYSFYITLIDGKQLQYHVIAEPAIGVKFMDEQGEKYRVLNFHAEEIWNALDEECYPATPRNIYAICYQGKVYRGTAMGEKVPSHAQWIGTVSGITYHPQQELECSLLDGKVGQSVYLWTENGTTKIGVEVEQGVWEETYAFVQVINPAAE